MNHQVLSKDGNVESNVEGKVSSFFRQSKAQSKKMVAMLFVVPGLLSIQGCTDQEVLATVGVIGIVGGAVALGAAVGGSDSSSSSSTHYHSSHHHHSYYGQNNYYYQQNNHYNRPPYYGYGGYGRRPWAQNEISQNTSSAKVTTTPLASLKTADELNAVSLVSQRYQIPMASAAVLQKSIKEAVEKQDLKPLYEIGVSKEDLLQIGQGQMISNTALRNLSQKLDISEDNARKVIRQMMEDARASVQPTASDL